MKKFWHLLLLLAAALPLYAGPALRIDLVGHSPGTTLDTISAPEGAVFEHPAWDTKENSRRRRLWMYLPEVKDNQWRKFEIRFSPAERAMTSHGGTCGLSKCARITSGVNLVMPSARARSTALQISSCPP